MTTPPNGHWPRVIKTVSGPADAGDHTVPGTEPGDGFQAYSMSILHTMAVTVAPTLYQENVFAAILADYRSSFDSYWQKASSDWISPDDFAFFSPA